MNLYEGKLQTPIEVDILAVVGPKMRLFLEIFCLVLSAAGS
jgi:hypothetical protein